MILNYFMVLRQREFTFVTNSKIISWPVCTSLHSCSNPFPQFRKELFVLEYNVIKQRMLDNVPMYMFQNIPKYMSSKMFISNSKFSIFSENYDLKVLDFDLKMVLSCEKNRKSTISNLNSFLNGQFKHECHHFDSKIISFYKKHRYHQEIVWREQNEWASNKLKVKYD